MADPTKRVSAKVIITTEDGSILLVKDHWKNHWSFPGGVSEIGEAPTVTALREVLEETSIQLQAEDLQFLGVRYRGDGDRDSLQFMFAASRSREFIETNFFAADGEGEAWRLVSVAEAEAMLEEPTAASLATFLAAQKSGAQLYE
jgi:ADP-ribose pyrophosphatase YjhB (NUDIX family)